MADELKTIKFQLMLSESEAKAMDDWGFSHRIRTRAEAMRRLCHIGLTFDQHRADFIGAFKEQYEELTKALPILEGLAHDPDATEREKALGQIILKTVSKQIASVVLVRVITGIANNAKADKEIEDILSETRELTGGLSEKFHERLKNADSD